MSCAAEIKTLQGYIEVLEERKSQLETNISTIVSVIDKCKSWIEDEEKDDSSFSDLILLCVKATAAIKNVGNEQKTKHKHEPLLSASENCEESIQSTNDQLMFAKIWARFEVMDEAISSIKYSNNNREKYDKKMKKFSSGIKDKIKALEEGFLDNKDLIKHLYTDSMSKEKFYEIYDRTSSVEQVIRTHHTKIEQLESNIDEIQKKCVLLNKYVEKSESNLKDFMEREDREQRNQFENLEKTFGCALKLLMTKIQTLQKSVEQCIIQLKNNEKKIDKIDSELQILPSKFDKKPWMVTDMLSINDLDAMKNYYLQHTDKENFFTFFFRKNNIIIKHIQDVVDNNQCYDKQTGIFTIPCDGLYLVNFKINNCKQLVILSLVIRNFELKIVSIEKILCAEAIKGEAQLCNVIYLKKDYEICLNTGIQNKNAVLQHFAFVRL